MHFSVVIPVLNGAAFLDQAIRSARNQTLAPCEIIVADNGSSDDSVAIARRHAPAVRVIEVPRPGASAARAEAASVARGEGLMFLDADDLIAPDTLEALSSALSGHERAIACTPWRRYEKAGACWRARPPSCAPFHPGQDHLSAWLTEWYHPPCSLAWTRAAYDAAGGWDPDTTINQDGELVMRALIENVPLLRASGGMGYYRRLPDGGMSLSSTGRTLKGLDGRLYVLRQIETRLEEKGTAHRHRAALAHAYARVAEDARAAGDPAEALAASARCGTDRNGGVGRVRRARRALERASAVRISRWRNLPGRLREGRRAMRGASAPAALIPGEPAPADPLVSVILPTYNRAATLSQAIESVLSQTHESFELLVIDDGSTDSTPRVLAGHGDSRIRVLEQPENRGVAAARNRGLEEARGQFIAFIDSDDAWAPEKLARQVALMQRAPRHVGLVHTGLRIRHAENAEDWTPSTRGLVLPEILARNIVHFGTSSVMIRREVADFVGGFDPTLPANEDHDFWTRAAHFFAFESDPAPLTEYDLADTEPPGAKRSARLHANLGARDRFVTDHGYEAGRLGAIHAHQMESARRNLEWDGGCDRAGRRLLLKAARASPLRPQPWIWMGLSVLPRGARTAVVARLRRLKASL
jgi:glycosyltransferase involved in cell wall biosynthesis